MIVGGEVEDFGLGDGALLVRSHHLRGSEEDAREIGHLGPRHAIRGKDVWSREARSAGIQGSVGLWGAYIV